MIIDIFRTMRIQLHVDMQKRCRQESRVYEMENIKFKFLGLFYFET